MRFKLPVFFGVALLLLTAFTVTVWAEEVQTQSFEVQIDVGLDYDPEFAFPLQCNAFEPSKEPEASGSAETEDGDVVFEFFQVAVLSIPAQTESFRPSQLIAIPQYAVKLSQTPSAEFSNLPSTGFEYVELIGDLNGDAEPEAVFHFDITKVFASYEACMATTTLALEITVFDPEGSLYLLGTDIVQPETSESDEGDNDDGTAAPESAAAIPFSVSQTFAASHSETTQFVAMGSGIESVQVEIFNLSGERIFDSGVVQGNALSWQRLTQEGETVANGVYLYIVTVRGFNGEVTRSQVKKFLVLR